MDDYLCVMAYILYEVLLYNHPFPLVAGDCEKTFGSDLVEVGIDLAGDNSDLVEDGSDKGTHNETDVT